MEGTAEVKDGAGRESSAGDAISTVLLVFGLFLLLFFARSSICLILYNCFLPVRSGPIFVCLFFWSRLSGRRSPTRSVVVFTVKSIWNTSYKDRANSHEWKRIVMSLHTSLSSIRSKANCEFC
jgi:hypothetical protein